MLNFKVWSFCFQRLESPGNLLKLQTLRLQFRPKELRTPGLGPSPASCVLISSARESLKPSKFVNHCFSTMVYNPGNGVESPGDLPQTIMPNFYSCRFWFSRFHKNFKLYYLLQHCTWYSYTVICHQFNILYIP